ncbi:hypothetical protein BDZ45DRAFT_754728 [Acephala macrosclerotiorum]|nr:hypothetical protein BDZ45DRAFT_754728 [Acephala macrosclerotiorum]
MYVPQNNNNFGLAAGQHRAPNPNTPPISISEPKDTTSELVLFNLAGLLKDAIFLVFKQLFAEGNVATYVSLGLTCRSLYAILKTLHPKPIPFRLRTCNHRSILAQIGHDVIMLKTVAEFLGPGYRWIWAHKQKPLAWRSRHFLNKDAYGKEGSTAKDGFQHRMLDYLRLQGRDPSTRTTVEMLPCPLGKGEDWYEEVFQMVGELDKSSWSAEAVEHWKREWPETSVTERVQMENLPLVWGEWRDMVGW